MSNSKQYRLNKLRDKRDKLLTKYTDVSLIIGAYDKVDDYYVKRKSTLKTKIQRLDKEIRRLQVKRWYK